MKNIILIMTDTFRWDNLGDRAEKPVRTPHLDRFATEKASSIEGFHIGSFPTIPHRTDMAQSVLGWPHYPWQPIDLSGPNHIATLLGDVGYATQLICDCPHLFNARFQHGFDAALHVRGQEGDIPQLLLNEPFRSVMPREKTRQEGHFKGHTLIDTARWHNRYFRYEEETFASRTSKTVVRWLEENSEGGPFFLWVDFFDPHEPWEPPEYMVRHYDPDYDGAPMLHPNYGPASDYTDPELHNLWAHYAAEAELTDRMIGRVLEKIEDLDLWKDSVVVVASDHGFSIGEHDRTGKTNIHPTDPDFWPIYPECGHVPFMLAGESIPTGKSLDILAQPIDIMPTLADLAGTDLTPPQPFEGRSFADLVLESGSGNRDFVVSGSFVRQNDGSVPAKVTTPFLTTRQWGYTPVGAKGPSELYDLTKDPLATQNLARDNPGIVSEMEELLLAHLREHNAPDELIKSWQARTP